ncbi:DsbA family protein [Peribacillus kribbensis]|uniref:DsbA family protein n=1 Tax=Peribacillus kribbensis TaxID=356658 RepID=UPI000401A2F3|nr:DsbA family protein [Peribacillus kribbensis]
MAKKKNEPKQSRAFFYWVAGLIVVGIILIVILSNLPKKEAVFDYKDQPYLGKKDAPVNIVEFGDYKCPVCKNFTVNVFPGIDKDLIQTGKAKLYFMNDPIIYTDSDRSAEFGETVYHELGNDAFWKFHDKLYNKQPEDPKYERMDLYKTEFLTETLKEAVSDKEAGKVEAAFNKRKYKEALDKDKSYVEDLKVTGTPTFFVNGKQFKGDTYQDLVDMVNKAAKESK